MKTCNTATDELIGTYRSFGTEGPVYQILRMLGDDAVRIVLVETGEELDYPLQEALRDPEAE